MAKPNPRKANGTRRRRIRARWKAIGAPCALCGRPIDYSLGMVVDRRTGRRRPHPMSFVVDEIVPVSRGGDPLDFRNTQPAHWICNARRGDGRKGKQWGARPGIATTDELPLPQPWGLWDDESRPDGLDDEGRARGRGERAGA
jgi:hypothetical protein